MVESSAHGVGDGTRQDVIDRRHGRCIDMPIHDLADFPFAYSHNGTRSALLIADTGETPLPGAPAPHRSDARRPRAWATRSPGPVPGTRRLARVGRTARRR